MEACRVLDRLKALKAVLHAPATAAETEETRKRRRLEANDYYVEDEDEFFDRTGDIAMKRQQRRFRSKPDSMKPGEVDTYESLNAKLEAAQSEIADLTKQLQASQAEAAKGSADAAGSNMDALDAFLVGLRSGVILDPRSKARMRARVQILRREEARVTKLMQVAKPTLSSLGIVTVSTVAPAKARLPIVPKASVSPANEPTTSPPKEEEFEEDSRDEVSNEIDTKPATISSAIPTTPAIQSLAAAPPKPKSDPLPAATARKEVRLAFSSRIRSSAGKIEAPLPQKESKQRTSTGKSMKRPDSSTRSSALWQEDNEKYSLWLPPKDATEHHV